MVCDKCEKKLGRIVTPDPWKSGARNTVESGGRKVVFASMPGIENIMGGNSQSYASKEVTLEDGEELQLEPEPLSPSSDSCSQDVEREHLCKNVKKKRNIQKVYSEKRSCPARFAKETPFKKFKESSKFEYPQTMPDRFKLPKTQTSVLPDLEPSHGTEQMDFGEFDQDNLPLRRRYFYKSRCKSISKYWQSVERYCRAVTKGDIKYLHQLIAKQEHTETISYNIPPLGEHYSVRWAKKDLTDEEIASNANRSRQRGIVQPPTAVINLLQQGTDEVKRSLSPISDTASHPVHSLLNEHFNKLLDEEISSSDNFVNDSSEVELDSRDSDTHLESLVSDSHLQVEIPNGDNEMRTQENVNLSLENRLKRDLEGIGDICYDGHEREDDEIVLEMKRCVAQMNALRANNIIQLKRCLKLAENEMKKQELRQKLRVCDSEILLHHQKIQMSKLRRDSAHKQDRDYAWKLLKNRESLIKRLDSFNDDQH